ncbi:MAG: c-type cytochrome [Syntrophales bacterium]
MKKLSIVVAIAFVVAFGIGINASCAQDRGAGTRDGGNGYDYGPGMMGDYGPGYGMGPGMMGGGYGYGPGMMGGYGPGYGMGPGMMGGGYGYGPGMMGGYGPGYGMGPGMMGGGYGYGPGMMGGYGTGPGYGEQYGRRQLAEPLDKNGAKQQVERYLRATGNPNLKIGKIESQEQGFDVEILTKEGSLVDRILVNKNTGAMRSLYVERPRSVGTAWAEGAFRSNGERIYFTATSERGTPITYAGGPAYGGWMMMGGRLACVSCHGPDGKGGRHAMGMMGVMDAKDIRWKTLGKEYNFEKFRLAVVKGQDPDGTELKPDMPRWNIGNDDLVDLIAFLKTLP